MTAKTRWKTGASILVLAVAAAALGWSQWSNRLFRAGLADGVFGTTAADDLQPAQVPAEFFFARLMYNGGSWGYKFWGTDYPRADRQLLAYLSRLTGIRAAAKERPVRIREPELYRYPFIYTSEPEQMELSDSEALILRNYLQRGGFWVMDDFWGTEQWASFERQLRKVLPNEPVVDLPLDHELFHCYYDLTELIQVPAGGRTDYSQGTSEEDGFVPHCRGIFDKNGRLMVVINWNTDLGDGWEWSGHPSYPSQYSTAALKLGINMVVYALSH